MCASLSSAHPNRKIYSLFTISLPQQQQDNCPQDCIAYNKLVDCLSDALFDDKKGGLSLMTGPLETHLPKINHK